MAKQFSVRGICELALQVVAEYAVHDQAADADSFRRTLDWFEVVAAAIYAAEEPLWVASEQALIDIPASPNPFDFVTAAGSSVIDPNRFQMAKEAWLVDTTTGRRRPLGLLWRQDYEAIEMPNITGIPDNVYIDRKELTPKAYFDRNIVVTTYQLGLSWYATSPTYTATGAHEFPGSWQLYIALKLARAVGSGPVVTLPLPQLKDIDERIKAARADLIPANRQTRTPVAVRSRDIQ